MRCPVPGITGCSLPTASSSEVDRATWLPSLSFADFVAGLLSREMYTVPGCPNKKVTASDLVPNLELKKRIADANKQGKGKGKGKRKRGQQEEVRPLGALPCDREAAVCRKGMRAANVTVGWVPCVGGRRRAPVRIGLCQCTGIRTTPNPTGWVGAEGSAQVYCKAAPGAPIATLRLRRQQLPPPRLLHPGRRWQTPRHSAPRDGTRCLLAQNQALPPTRKRTPLRQEETQSAQWRYRNEETVAAETTANAQGQQGVQVHGRRRQ